MSRQGSSRTKGRLLKSQNGRMLFDDGTRQQADDADDN